MNDAILFNSWFATISAFSVSLTLLFALCLDLWLGEPRKFHHLVGFGNVSQLIEKKLNRQHQAVAHGPFSMQSALLGGISWCLLVLPVPVIYYALLDYLSWYWQLIIDSIILYLAIGLRSLDEHAMQVFQPLKQGDIKRSRHFTGYLVSRDTQQLSPEEMSRATVESMLENGHDAVISSFIYYIIGGIPLVIVHRLANTLDAMWGYKNPRFLSFGCAAARLDDLLGFITGKCCTLLYALQQPFFLCLKNAFHQGNQYKSHNGGWVMAAGATVMSRKLGGSAHYHGKGLISPTLGCGNAITINDIPVSVTIVKRACGLLISGVFLCQGIMLLYTAPGL